jgi:hypothetical protein
MDKKRSNITDFHRQRERIRRITVGSLVVAMVFILGSCEWLTPRDANGPRSAASRISQDGRGTAGAGPRSRSALDPAGGLGEGRR